MTDKPVFQKAYSLQLAKRIRAVETDEEAGEMVNEHYRDVANYIARDIRQSCHQTVLEFMIAAQEVIHRTGVVVHGQERPDDWYVMPWQRKDKE